MALCAASLVFPVPLGWMLIQGTLSSVGAVGTVAAAIGYLTIWILLRKRQWRLIEEIWRFGKRLSESVVEPVRELIDRVWERAEKIGEWVERERR